MGWGGCLELEGTKEVLFLAYLAITQHPYL